MKLPKKFIIDMYRKDMYRKTAMPPDKPVPEQEDKWDGKCLICLIRKLGYKIRIDNFKHTCSLKDYDS